MQVKIEANSLPDQLKKLYYNEENVTRFKRAKEVAVTLGVSIADVVLGYLTTQPFVTIPVVGCRTKK